MNAPRVSVIIPCYGEVPFLEETLQSVARTKIHPLEVILVDDGSPVPLKPKFAKLVAAFPSLGIRFFEQTNGGPQKARNTAVRQSLSSLILPLDSDDLLESQHISHFLKRIEAKPEIDIVYGDYECFGGQTELRKAVAWDQAKLNIQNGLPYCSIYRRSLWEKVGGYNEVIPYGVEDWQFWIHAWMKGARGEYLPKTILRYRVREGSLTSNVNSRDLETKAHIIESLPDAYTPIQREWAKAILARLSMLEALGTARGRWHHRVGVMPSDSLAALDLALISHFEGLHATSNQWFVKSLEKDDSAPTWDALTEYVKNLEHALNKHEARMRPFKKFWRLLRPSV